MKILLLFCFLGMAVVTIETTGTQVTFTIKQTTSHSCNGSADARTATRTASTNNTNTAGDVGCALPKDVLFGVFILENSGNAYCARERERAE